ncbi:MAG TPA: LuxR C-terminal-related transcriptional regulator [Gaiellaceae bacterium]|jgi:PAS domain S-box-containing protein
MEGLPESPFAAGAAAVLFERTGDAVVTVDPGGVVTAANPAAEALTGYPTARLVGVPVTQVVAPEDRERATHELRVRLVGALPDVPVALVLLRADGTRVSASSTWTVAGPDVVGIIRASNGRPPETTTLRATPAPLTPREQQVLALIADGLTNDKVASVLGISPETVQSHVRHAMVKLSADSRTEAVATALRRSLIP